MKSTFFVGLDVHLRHTNVCILDQRGNRVKQATVRGPWSEIVTLLQGLLGRFKFASRPRAATVTCLISCRGSPVA